MNEEIRKAVAQIRNQPNVRLVSIVNADGNEVPVEYAWSKDESRRAVSRLLRDQRAVKGEKNLRVRTRNHTGNVERSRAI